MAALNQYTVLIPARKPKHDQEPYQDPSNAPHKEYQCIHNAAQAGANWKDLAAIIGVSTRTLRRWREEVEKTDYFAAGVQQDSQDEDIRPVPDEAASIVTAIHAGRAAGRQELINTIRQLSVEKEDMRGLMALLKRMDTMDE